MDGQFVCVPWNKYGLIAELVEKLADKSPQFGKTALMKFIFILQEIYKVPCGYEFSLYTYGPYCSDVLDDLEYIDALDGVEIIGLEKRGYVIRSGKESGYFRKKADGFLCHNKEKIDKAVEMFGSMTARELELRSTIIYIVNNYRHENMEVIEEDLFNGIKEIKPQFSLEEIKGAYKELLKNKIIS